MPSASIPKTRFLHAQNPPLLPPSARLRSSPLSRALLQLQLRNTIDSTLHTTTRRTPEESETTTAYYPTHLQTIGEQIYGTARQGYLTQVRARLFISNDRDPGCLWAILTFPSRPKGLGRDSLLFTSVVLQKPYTPVQL